MCYSDYPEKIQNISVENQHQSNSRNEIQSTHPVIEESRRYAWYDRPDSFQQIKYCEIDKNVMDGKRMEIDKKSRENFYNAYEEESYWPHRF